MHGHTDVSSQIFIKIYRVIVALCKIKTPLLIKHNHFCVSCLDDDSWGEINYVFYRNKDLILFNAKNTQCILINISELASSD